MHVLHGYHLCFTTPRRLPKPDSLPGGVVVLDIAFAGEGGGSRSGFEQTTLRLIDGLGPRLLRWVDHHDSLHHARFSGDPRFVLARKSEHGGCPEMVTPELVAATPRPDTIACHVDFDGLCAAAKWILDGREPYPGNDADARAVDTCSGPVGPIGRRLERALRARPRDLELCAAVLRHLVDGGSGDGEQAIDVAARELAAREHESELLAAGYRSMAEGVLLVDATGHGSPYDKTHLLLLGQTRAQVAAVVDADTVTFAAPFDSGIDFLSMFGLSSGMPTRVSIRRSDLPRALAALGADDVASPPPSRP